MEFGEKIKLGLECCRNVWVDDHWKNCDGACPYQAEQSYCKNVLHHDTLAYIRQLEAELAQVKRAATDDLMKALRRGDGAMFCDFCKHCDEDGNCDDPCYPYDPEKSRWEWRGVQEDD